MYGKFTTISSNYQGKTGCEFNGAVHINDKIYFTPYCADDIGVIFLKKNKFYGSVIVDQRIYYVPYNANCIGILDTDTHIFTTIDIEDYTSGDKKFRGAVH